VSLLLYVWVKKVSRIGKKPGGKDSKNRVIGQRRKNEKKRTLEGEGYQRQICRLQKGIEIRFEFKKT